MHELKQDAKCVECQGNIFYKNNKHRLAMHVGVQEAATGVRHDNCVLHLQQEAKRLARLNKAAK